MKRKVEAESEELKTFLATVPLHLEERLREEAKTMKRSRTAQLARILEERYGFAQPEHESQPAAA